MSFPTMRQRIHRYSESVSAGEWRERRQTARSRRFGTNIPSDEVSIVVLSAEFAAPGSGRSKAVFFIVYCQKNARCQ